MFAHLLVQMQIKENIKAPRHCHLYGEFAGDPNVENVSIWWRHHTEFFYITFHYVQKRGLPVIRNIRKHNRKVIYNVWA